MANIAPTRPLSGPASSPQEQITSVNRELELVQPAEASAAPAAHADHSDWKSVVAEYQKPHAGRASWQLASTLLAYAVLWVAMYWSLTVSWWLAAPFAILAGGLLVRVFIIFHDCGHGSFLASRKANAFWGFVTGLLTFTPFEQWRSEHAVHHGATGDLDRRGVGDVWTMTVQEYLEASRGKRFAYRLARNPIVAFVIAPIVLFLVIHRFTRSGAKPRERSSVRWMNFALLGMGCVMSLIFGLGPYVLLQLGVLTVASTLGVWIFYLQHQFEAAYWERGEDWDYVTAALKGSSFLKLPKVLQWFSGNIGFHHIHHLSPRIPNYNLERCHKSNTMFHDVTSITLLGSLRSLPLRLWDESSKQLIGYRGLRKVREERRRMRRSA